MQVLQGYVRSKSCKLMSWNNEAENGSVFFLKFLTKGWTREEISLLFSFKKFVSPIPCPYKLMLPSDQNPLGEYVCLHHSNHMTCLLTEVYTLAARFARTDQHALVNTGSFSCRRNVTGKVMTILWICGATALLHSLAWLYVLYDDERDKITKQHGFLMKWRGNKCLIEM